MSTSISFKLCAIAGLVFLICMQSQACRPRVCMPWHSPILADQLTLSQQRWGRLCSLHYYWHPQIFGLSYGPALCSIDVCSCIISLKPIHFHVLCINILLQSNATSNFETTNPAFLRIYLPFKKTITVNKQDLQILL